MRKLILLLVLPLMFACTGTQNDEGLLKHVVFFKWHDSVSDEKIEELIGAKAIIYTNGTPIAEFGAGEYQKGFVAMIALSESGLTTCEFNNTWLWLAD